MVDTDKQQELDVADVKQLTDFFGKYSTAIESSGFGAQLERAAGLHFGCRKCPSCKGRRSVEKRVMACGKCTAGRTDKGKCDHCVGGVIEVRAVTPMVGEFTVQDQCEECNGFGVVARTGHKRNPKGKRGVPANPTGSSKGGTEAPEPQVEAWCGYHQVAKRLLLLLDEDVTALGLYYGIGDYWSKQRPDLGQIWPVLAMTVQCKRLLKKHTKEPSELNGRMLVDSAWSERMDKDGVPFDVLKLSKEEGEGNRRTLPEWEDMTQPEKLAMLRECRSVPGSLWKSAEAEAEATMARARVSWRLTVWRRRELVLRPRNLVARTRPARVVEPVRANPRLYRAYRQAVGLVSETAVVHAG